MEKATPGIKDWAPGEKSYALVWELTQNGYPSSASDTQVLQKPFEYI